MRLLPSLCLPSREGVPHSQGSTQNLIWSCDQSLFPANHCCLSYHFLIDETSSSYVRTVIRDTRQHWQHRVGWRSQVNNNTTVSVQDHTQQQTNHHNNNLAALIHSLTQFRNWHPPFVNNITNNIILPFFLLGVDCHWFRGCRLETRIFYRSKWHQHLWVLKVLGLTSHLIRRASAVSVPITRQLRRPLQKWRMSVSNRLRSYCWRPNESPTETAISDPTASAPSLRVLLLPTRDPFLLSSQWCWIEKTFWNVAEGLVATGCGIGPFSRMGRGCHRHRWIQLIGRLC